MSTLTASVSIFDEAGGETAAEGSLRVTPGGDPGTVALWIGDHQAGVVIDDLERFTAELGAVRQGA